MRSDVTLYIVAAFFFTLTLTATILFTEIDRIFWIILSTSLGILFIGAGYSQRPKTKTNIKTIPQTTPTTNESPPVEPITQEAPVDEAPVDEAPVDEAPVDEAPVDEAPVDEAPVDGLPSSVESVPAEGSQTSSLVDAPAEETELINEESQSPPQEPVSTVATQNNDTASTQVKQTEENNTDDEVPLTNVKGVGEKRAAQLNALGINNAKELSQASAEDLAKNLKISPKIAAKLIEAAKQQ
ncbi:MAG: helix-hairpin-helix domain-containing protein [Candidatus Bathyarchaeota archaeon]|nr:helix-hairpin-helix domain-containing protein [Candidatus Termiticorpusculum sp.]